MMTDGKRDFYVSGMQAGILSPEQQQAFAEDLISLLIEFKVMRTTLDEIVQNEIEQDQISQRQAELDNAVRAGEIAGVTPFPRRALPVRLAMPPIYAVEGETWR